MNFRKLHRKIAPILFLPLLLTALTGVVYRLGRNWFDLPNAAAEVMMTIHEGGFLGEALVPIYVLLMGLGLLGLIATGLIMITKRKPGKAKANVKQDWRWYHRIIAPIALLPLLISATTGIGYRLGKAWFGLSNDQAAILLRLHQGSYLGDALKPIYVLLVGLGLLVLLISGIQMTGIFRKRQPKSPANS